MNYSGVLALAAYAALVLIGMALETVGVPRAYLAIAMSLPAIAGAIAVVVTTATMREAEYLHGRKASTVAETGAWIAIQSAAVVVMAAAYVPSPDIRLALAIGAVFGAAVAGRFIAPALRESGTFTLPEFLYRRFGSDRLRLLAAAAVVAVTFPLSCALVTSVAEFFGAALGIPSAWAAYFVCGISLLGVLSGGANTLTAGQFARLMLFAIAGLTPVAWITLGDAAFGAMAWPSLADSTVWLIVLALGVAAGIAVQPVLYTTVPSTAGAAETPGSAWTGAIFTTLLIGAAVLFSVARQAPADSAARLPEVLGILALVAAIVAALVATASLLVTMANTLGRDVYYFLTDRAESFSRELLVFRALVVATAAAVALAAALLPLDVTTLTLWSLSLSAGMLFAPVALSIWWDRTSAAGVLAGVAAGGVVSVAMFLIATNFSSAADGLGTSPLLAFTVSAAATVWVSMTSRRRAPVAEAR